MIGCRSSRVGRQWSSSKKWCRPRHRRNLRYRSMASRSNGRSGQSTSRMSGRGYRRSRTPGRQGRLLKKRTKARTRSGGGVGGTSSSTHNSRRTTSKTKCRIMRSWSLKRMKGLESRRWSMGLGCVVLVELDGRKCVATSGRSGRKRCETDSRRSTCKDGDRSSVDRAGSAESSIWIGRNGGCSAAESPAITTTTTATCRRHGRGSRIGSPINLHSLVRSAIGARGSTTSRGSSSCRSSGSSKSGSGVLIGRIHRDVPRTGIPGMHVMSKVGIGPVVGKVHICESLG